jgi:predicted NBD/HSP70 family sugar kinase
VTKHSKAERIDQIIAAISEEGPLTYRELLPKLPGLSTEQHVGNIVAEGKRWGVLQNLSGDGDLPAWRMKEKAAATKFVEIARPAGCVVGVNVGRTYFAIGVADPNGRLLSTYGDPPRKGLGRTEKEAAWARYRKGQMVVHERGSGLKGATLLNHTATKTLEWLEAVGIEEGAIRGITLSLPTPVSTTRSKTLTNSIERSLAAVPSIERKFISALGGRSRYPSLKKVVLANDADVAARGEVRYGNAHGKRDVIAVHAAFGVGAGIIADGGVLRTGAGGGAGEIGHTMPRIVEDEGAEHGLPPLDPDDELYTCVCGGEGHLEAMAGGAAIVKRIAKACEDETVEPPKRLIKVLNDPDKTVAAKLDAVLKVSSGKKAWEPGAAALSDAARLLGGVIHTLAHIFHPEAVYLSGKLSEAGKDFLEGVQGAYEQLGSLASYSPRIALGTASGHFNRRLIMVRGAAMTAVRSTDPLIELDHLRRLEKEHAPEPRRERIGSAASG